MKKILFVESGSGFGGSSVCLYNVLRCLDTNTFSPTVLHYRYGPNIEKIKSLGVPTVQSRGMFLWIMLPWLCLRDRFSLIHTNNDLYSQVPAIFFAKLFGIRCISHIRGIKKLTKRERIVSRYVGLFLCVSYAAGEALVKQGIDGRRIIVVYDGIDLKHLVQTAHDGVLRKELGLDRDMRLVGLVTRFTKGKGIEYFIKAAELVSRQYRNVKFVITGGVTDAAKQQLFDELQQLVKDAGLENELFFLGWRKDVGMIYNSLDIAVSTSLLEEYFGMVNVEAMAAGKPVIATDVGAYKEIVIDGMNGFLVPPKDAQAIADKITVLLKDEGLSQKMGGEGRRRARELFDSKKSVKVLEGIYSELLNN